MPLPREIALDIFWIRATDVNVYLLREADALTLVDAGYPADAARITVAVGSLGHRMKDVRALLITHANVDHIGTAQHIHDRYGISAYAGALEVAHARQEYVEQASPRVSPEPWRPSCGTRAHSPQWRPGRPE